MLRNVDWELVKDFSEKTVDSVLQGHAVQEYWIYRLSRNVGDYQCALPNTAPPQISLAHTTADMATARVGLHHNPCKILRVVTLR